ncbi:MAG: XRE family transcriptional regulator [Bacteroidia bacterium]
MKMGRKKIEITVEKTDTGFSAYANDLSVFSTGKDIPELYVHLVEAINLLLEEDGEGVISLSDLKLNLDLKQFFQYYKVLNARFLARRIGMNPTLLSQYVRGVKRPSPKQTEKIIQGIQGIGRELSDLRFI